MSEVEVRGDQVFLYNSEGHATPMSPAEALRLARELTRAADSLLDQPSDPTFTGGGSMEGSMPFDVTIPSRADRRRADWDSLSRDQKVQARIDGSEFVPLTLEQRIERLERHIVEIESRPNPYDVIRGADGR